jgi:catechol 2,3-dioxygenase-like lactoylglutathione lyase family enzyme
MLGDADAVAFVATTDPLAARTFYGDVLGLPLVDDSPFAVVFDANGTTLRVTVVHEAVVAPYTVLGWEVADIAATVAELVGRGVVFERFDGMDQDDLGIWNSPSGARVALFKDPQGNVLSLTEA